MFRNNARDTHIVVGFNLDVADSVLCWDAAVQKPFTRQAGPRRTIAFRPTHVFQHFLFNIIDVETENNFKFVVSYFSRFLLQVTKSTAVFI